MAGPPVSDGDTQALYVDRMAQALSAADAWSLLVLFVVSAEADPATIAAWAALAATSPAALRQRCYAAGVPPRRSLMFARLLRAVWQAQGRQWFAAEWLKAGDPRTLRALLRRSGLAAAAEATPTVIDFLGAQSLVHAQHPGLRALARRLAQSGEATDT